jgi:plasmid stability protein
MVLILTQQLEAALREQAQRHGVSPEVLAVDALRERFLPDRSPIEPQDDWERRLFDAAIDCGVSVPNSALSSDGLYE